MKTLVIYNPRSGRSGRNARLLPLVQAFVAAKAPDCRIVRTEGPGHATALAREGVAAGCPRIVAVGGDGTMNEVAQALVHTPAALGLVPCGSGNGLALHLGLPLSPIEALGLALGSAGRIALVDSGTVNGKPFFNAMGVGLDADVSERFNRLTTRGLPAYARTAASAFFSAKTERCVVTAGGRRHEVDSLLIAVANSDQYGNRALIAPGARVDDGELDLVIVGPVGILGACSLGAKLFAGTFDRSSAVKRLRGTRFTIERVAPGLIHTDGETHTGDRVVQVEVLQRCLKIVVPMGCRAIATAVDRAPRGFALQLP